MCVVDVLKVTTPALGTRGTAWINPMFRRLQNFLSDAEINFLPLVGDSDFCAFAGHGATDENNTTLDVRDKVTTVGYFSDLGNAKITHIQG